MTVELVGLAYDQKLTDSIWSVVPARAAYDLILADEFRRKVDFRSMLYHKGQLELLTELEQFLKKGGEKLSLVELIAARFSTGIEDYPNPAGEFGFDFQLIRHFSSLAMADDFLVAETFLRELLRRVGFLTNGTGWSLLGQWDFEAIVAALKNVRMSDILEVGKRVPSSGGKLSFENLVRNYLEFLNYSQNNSLTPFFYNSQTDLKRWGNLAQRKNSRNELIVDLSLRPRKSQKMKKEPAAPKTLERSFNERAKLRRESDALLGGLKDSDPLIRQKSAESLGKLSDTSTLPHLIAALTDPEPEVRQEIVRAIGAVADPEANEALLKVLETDEAFSVRLTAAWVLRRRREKRSIPVLLDALEQRNPHVSAELAYHPLLAADRETVTRLRKLVSHEAPEVRREVAFILGRVPSKLSSEPLANMVNDPDVETGVIALYSLWEARSARVVEASKKLSSSPHEAAAQAGSIVSAWAKNLSA
ncbi:MAG: HEAT repeat domain-containing protein [Pseudomonadota bacterium]